MAGSNKVRRVFHLVGSQSANGTLRASFIFPSSRYSFNRSWRATRISNRVTMRKSKLEASRSRLKAYRFGFDSVGARFLGDGIRCSPFLGGSHVLLKQSWARSGPGRIRVGSFGDLRKESYAARPSSGLRTRSD